MIPIYLGILLDLLFGDPEGLPHPIIYIGKFIKLIEDKIYDLNINKKILGFILLFSIVISVYLLNYFILYLASTVSHYLAIAIESFMIFQILAIKGLKDESKKVYFSLKNNAIEKAREELSMLVTRETQTMDEEQIIQSTIETIAENIVDAITAPLFFIFIGGAPLGFVYKAINTLDSMVGYKNDRYESFGYFSAKLDDVMNFIPSRITGFLIVLASFILRYNYEASFKCLVSDHDKTSSPNSGFSEAPIAGALDIHFGGKVTYFGKTVVKPEIGFNSAFELEKINDAIKLMYLTSFIAVIVYTVVVMI